MYILYEYYYIQRFENFFILLQFLKGIRFKYNLLICDEFIKMELELRRFEYFIVLDLLCNIIYFY